MYNFSLGMLFAICAMAYTYIFVPESRPKAHQMDATELKAMDARLEKPGTAERIMTLKEQEDASETESQ